jgi:protein-L-isoaspartate(D-aspartate) O-methyltransferase
MLSAEHIEKRGIHDTDVLRAMHAVPRQEFVPKDLIRMAYEDRPLDIGYGATISQPYIVAAMTQLLELRKHHRVLEIGTGSGYQAAVLAELAGRVYSIELVLELARTAAEKLWRLGYRNVAVRHGDGYQGWPEHAPYDRIVLTAAPPELPAALINQLAPEGRLVAPVGSKEDQQLMVIDKPANGAIHRRVVFPVLFVPMVPST